MHQPKPCLDLLLAHADRHNNVRAARLWYRSRWNPTEFTFAR